jgi:hypothetical protein
MVMSARPFSERDNLFGVILPGRYDDMKLWSAGESCYYHIGMIWHCQLP